MCPREQKKWPLIENKQAEKAFPGKSPSSLQHFEYIFTSGCISEYFFAWKFCLHIAGKNISEYFFAFCLHIAGKKYASAVDIICTRLAVNIGLLGDIA